ncbi:LuxR C-terminal-related transcriptional regulator [Kribbella solani]|uniref:response regulator transcription factor n=1 Tax=Kribbella solani TaxID=236067 RepID=UPI0029A5D53B|nr:LuxR C-terminal-related transcriptional regulator [Kribbella solani]MDX2972292.1 LuxR C-terminal-related transcriptional regulator [Kribbella solani]MDX3001763.1 LuxR C-terminal-related transcriptional regulator [Kribbella solani]
MSDREVEVVQAVGREIAADLFISLSTVKGHTAGIQTKLGARNRTELAVWAWQSGLL